MATAFSKLSTLSKCPNFSQVEGNTVQHFYFPQHSPVGKNYSSSSTDSGSCYEEPSGRTPEGYSSLPTSPDPRQESVSLTPALTTKKPWYFQVRKTPKTRFDTQETSQFSLQSSLDSVTSNTSSRQGSNTSLGKSKFGIRSSFSFRGGFILFHDKFLITCFNCLLLYEAQALIIIYLHSILYI